MMSSNKLFSLKNYEFNELINESMNYYGNYG